MAVVPEYHGMVKRVLTVLASRRTMRCLSRRSSCRLSPTGFDQPAYSAGHRARMESFSGIARRQRSAPCCENSRRHRSRPDTVGHLHTLAPARAGKRLCLPAGVLRHCRLEPIPLPGCPRLKSYQARPTAIFTDIFPYGTPKLGQETLTAILPHSRSPAILTDYPAYATVWIR